MIRKVWRKITAVTVIMSFSALEIGLAQPLPVSELLQGLLPEKKVEETPAPSSISEDGFFVPDSLSFLESDSPLNKVTDDKTSSSQRAVILNEVSARMRDGSVRSSSGGKDLRVDSAEDLEGEIHRLTSEVQQAQNDKMTKAQGDNATIFEQNPERMRFEDALEELRRDYASAVIIEDLTENNLLKLLDLSFETAIFVIHGEIILVTSGSEDEIGVLPAVQNLAQKAALISHTHPGLYSAEGPSGQDLNEAVEAPKQESVITHAGVYAYNQQGLLHESMSQSYIDFLDQIHEAIQMSQSEDSILARQELNTFIQEQDRYNEATEEERVTFRRGGTLTYTSGLTSSSVTTLSGNPYPYRTAGSTSATTLSVSSNQFSLGYSVPGAADVSGLTVSFDNASTPAVETQNISALANLTFGLKGPNTSVKLEIVDINNVKDALTLTNIVNTAERFWRVPISSILSTLDKTKIKQMNFIVGQANTTAATRAGTLLIRTNGLNSNAPAVPVMTSAIPAATNLAAITLSGTKEANTAILINNTPYVVANNSTTWSAVVNLTAEGNNTFAITAKNALGKLSTAASITVKKDTVVPTGSININSGALYAAANSVTLNLSGTDSGSGMDKMSFSTDNVTWSAAEVYAVSKTFTLPAGEGNKTVYVKFYDKAGNASAVYSKSIILDTLVPTGTMTVNGGVQAVKQTAVTLNLSAVDAGSGIDKMSFSSNNSTWSTAETFATSKAWNLAAGDGNKTVYVKFLDKSGKWSNPVLAAVILDTVIPTGSININSGAAFTSSGSVTLNLSAADGGSGIDKMSFSTDGNLWTSAETYAASKTFTLSAGDGTKTAYVKYFDKAGNVSAVSSKSIMLDTVPPTGSVVIKAGEVYSKGQSVALTLTAQDATSGVDQMQFSMNGGTTWSVWEAFATQRTVNLTSGDGTKEVLYRIRDKAGLIAAFSDTIILDTTAPTATIKVGLNDDAYVPGTGITLNLTASDSLSGMHQMRFSLDDGVTWIGWTTFAATKTLTLPSGDGSKKILFQVRDKALNPSVTYTKTVMLDTTLPSGSIKINGGAVSTTSANVTLDLTAQDAASGIDQTRISLDTGQTWGSWENFTAQKNVTLPQEAGTKEVRYQVRDKAGNVQTFSASIQLGGAAPQIVFTSAATALNRAYALTYTVNGVARTENWQLASGINNLFVRVEENGQSAYAKYRVTLNQSAPAVPDMPAVPVLSENLLSVTTDNGLILKYDQDVLKAVENPGQYELYYPELDAGGNLIGGMLYDKEGARLLFKDAKSVYQITKNGDKTFYDDDGTARSYESSLGAKTRFAYKLDAAGKSIALMSLEDNAASLYESQVPVWIVMTDGTDIRYSNGFLTEYTDASANKFYYQTVQVSVSGTIITGYLSQLVSVKPSGAANAIALGNILNSLASYPTVKATLETKLSLELEYDKDKIMKRVKSGKGETLQLQAGLPISLTDSAGHVTGLFAETDTEGSISRLGLLRDGLSQFFDREGQLQSITLRDGTILTISAEKLKEIKLEDGSVLDGLLWDGEQPTDFVRTKPDGTEETYAAGHIVRKKEPNGNVTTFFFDTVAAKDTANYLTTPDGRTYHFIEYKNGRGLTDHITELQKVDLPDGSRVEFEHGKPVRFVEKKEIHLAGTQLPDLPQGQSFIPELDLGDAKFRAVTIDGTGTILSGEMLFYDGTQYFIENGGLTRQITADGQVVEVRQNTEEQPLPVFDPVPPQGYNVEEQAYRDSLINQQLDFFINGVGIDPKTGFPMDNFDAVTGQQSTYSQATLVGMWAEILSAIALGHWSTPKITKAQAFQKLDLMLQNLVTVQQQAGWSGMFSFFGISQETRSILNAAGQPTGQTETVNVYKRQFNDIGIGDNLNLSVSLNSVIGAIGLVNDPVFNAARDRILSYCYHIVWKQDEGYSKFYDAKEKRFHMAYQFNPNGTGQFAGYMDRVFNEFRPGLIWLASAKPQYREAIENLDVAVRAYTTEDGQTIDNAVPFDGGAFQMFWPLIHVDETKYPEFDVALKNFLYTQAEYISENGIPGLLSAGSEPGKGYNGKMGMLGAAETDDPLETHVGSIYGTASAFLLAPHYTLQLLKNIEAAFPGVKTAKGYADALKLAEISQTDPLTGQVTFTTQPVFSQQYYGVDQAGFLLSLMGTSRSYFKNYLTWQGIDDDFDGIYNSMIFGLAPVAQENPEAPKFVTTTSLFAGEYPDGYSHPLVKQAAYIASISDPAFGEGKIYDYLTPNGQFHHTEIEFEGRSFGFQEYILLPGRSQMARSLTAGLRYDLLDEGKAQGAFYTPGQGYASGALTLDPAFGEVRQINFNFQDVQHAVGLWTQFNDLDLTRYDYLSVPVKLGVNAKPGMRLKFQFKGMGEVFVSPALTSEWQFVEIPVIKPADPLKEIAVVVQTPDGLPAEGSILMGPLAAFKVRTSSQIDWTLLAGETDVELRQLLKQKALEQIHNNGGQVVADETLEDFTVDSEGKLIKGVLKRADGSVQYFNNGRLNKWIFSDGRTVLFEKGLATFILDLSRGRLEQSRYYYEQDFRGNIKSFILQDNERKRTYGSDGKILRMIDGENTVNFKDGVMDTIVLPQGVLSNLIFDDGGNLLSAHVKTMTNGEFDISQYGDQMIERENGVKVYYNDKRIVALETQNGRTDFTYNFDAAGRLLGVNTTFREEITDPVTGLKSMVTRQMSLLDYLRRPERSVEKSEILRESPKQLLPESGMIGFSVPGIPSSELTYALSLPLPENNQYSLLALLREGQQPGDAVGYLFKYQNTGGSVLGAASHQEPPVNISDYDFLNITLRQHPDMDWNQDFNLKLKTAGYATLFNFQLQNATAAPQTFSFPLDGKQGSEGEITLEVVRETGGVGKLARVYIQDISYMALKSLNNPLWENLLSISSKEIQQLKRESQTLTSVGAEIAAGKPLVYEELLPMLDLPTWVTYADQSPTDTGKLTSFKRFDGAEVTVEGTSVSKIILSDGTVNEYSQSGNAGQAEVSNSLDCGNSSECHSRESGNLDYHYGALRKVTQADGRQLNFSYEFDTDGKEITVIQDSVTGDTRRFKDGKLIQSTASDQRQTAYQYKDGELVSSEIMYKNRVLDSMHYAYTPEETQITDERGTTWYYDANGNLTKHLTKEGYLYRYTDVTQELGVQQNFAAGDFKNTILAAQDLQAVTLAGFEAVDGSQILFDEERENSGEVRLASKADGVNLQFDENQKIKSGQIQFADGLIIEIENYIPRRGRMQDGSLFDLLLPQAENYELLQGTDGAYVGYRLKIGGKFYTYGLDGRLSKFETEDGRTDTLSYFMSPQGEMRYDLLMKLQIVFRGIPYPKAMEIKAEKDVSNQKILRLMEGGQEIVSKEGNGFAVGVYKAATNQWDVQTGTFASQADRAALKSFLAGIKTGEYMTAVVSDTAFASAGEDILALFESMGAGGVRQASAQSGTNSWGFYGMKGLAPTEGLQKMVTGSDLIAFTTLTETLKVNLPTLGFVKTYEGQPLTITTPQTAADSFSAFLQGYEKLKISSDMQKVSVYDSQGDLAFSRRMDGVLSYYQLGKIRETYSAKGELLYVHNYLCPAAECKTGDDMKLASVQLVKARDDFEAEGKRLREQIEQAKFDALYKLASQNDEARVRINEIVQDGLTAIDNQISSLESQRYQDVKQCHGGLFGKKCKHFTVEVPGVQDAINNLRSQRADLLATQETELAKIPGGVAAKKLEIENATRDKLAEIAVKEDEFYTDILQNEIEPILTDYYRRILGRDHSTAELNNWITAAKPTGKINITQLESSLLSSPEKQTRENQKASIIQSVRSFLDSYLTASSAQKTTLLQSLKLDASDVIDLDRADADKILTYLETRSLHFGQSAFNSLREMLAAKGVSASLETIGRETILIDILMGVLNPFTEGELLISLFSLSKAAAIHSSEFSAVKYDYADLKAYYSAACPDLSQPCSLRMIAHIGEDHYVVITKVTDTEIFYRETSKGTDGEEVKVAREDFMKVWTKEDGRGYLLVDKAQLRTDRKISTVEAQKVKGSFLFLFFFFAALFLSAASAIVSTFSPALGRILGIAAMVAGVISVVASLGSLVLSGLKTAFNFVSQIAQQSVLNTLKAGLVGIGKVLMIPVHFVGRFISGGFTFLKEGFSAGLQALGNGIMKLKDFLFAPKGSIIFDIHHNIESQLFTSQQIAARQLVGFAIGAAGSKVLGGLGVNPVIANLATAFVSGGFTGTGSAMSGFLKSGLQHLVMQGVSEIGLKIGLPPPITSALSLITGNSLKAYFDPSLTLKKSLAEIAPTITAQFALSGMELVGRSLGVSPIFSKLIGLPFASGLAGLVGGVVNHVKPTDLFGVIKQTIAQGTASGLISIGANLALDQLGVSSNASELITNYLGRILAGSEAAGSAIAKAGQSVMSKITDSILKFGNIVKNSAGSVLSFSQKVLQQTGQFTEAAFKRTLGLFSPLLGRKTQEAIYQDLAGIRQGSVSINGDTWTWQAGDERVSYNTKTDSLIGGSGDEIANITGLGEVEGGGLTYASLTYEDIVADGMTMKKTFERGLLRDVQAYYSDVEIFKATGSKETGIVITEGGQFISEDIGLYRPTEIPLPPDFEKPANTDVKAYLPVYVWFETDNGWLVDANFTIEKRQIDTASNKELYVLTNGILNPDPNDAPGYLFNLEQDIIKQSEQKIKGEDFIIAHTFHASFLLKLVGLNGLAGTIGDVILNKLGGPGSFIFDEIAGKLIDFSINLTKDLAAWVLETTDPHAHAALATDVKTALEKYFQSKVSGERERNIVAVGFSGGFLPLVEVLQNAPKQEGINSGYKTTSVVALGAVTTGVEELMLKIAEAGDMIRRGKMTLALLDTALQSFLAGGVQFGAITLEKIKNFIINAQSEEAYQEYKKTVEAMTLNIENFAEASLLGTSAEMVVNVYGTKDAVADLQIDGKKLGGYRSELLGFTPENQAKTLFNIEIVGAGHNDYIRNDLDYFDFSGLTGAAAAIGQDWNPLGLENWNKTVSEFVADLIIASKDKQSLKEFLASSKFVSPDVNKPGSWKVYLPGYESRQ